jgi:hypothetical protein
MPLPLRTDTSGGGASARLRCPRAEALARFEQRQQRRSERAGALASRAVQQRRRAAQQAVAQQQQQQQQQQQRTTQTATQQPQARDSRVAWQQQRAELLAAAVERAAVHVAEAEAAAAQRQQQQAEAAARAQRSPLPQQPPAGAMAGVESLVGAEPVVTDARATQARPGVAASIATDARAPAPAQATATAARAVLEARRQRERAIRGAEARAAAAAQEAVVRARQGVVEARRLSQRVVGELLAAERSGGLRRAEVAQAWGRCAERAEGARVWWRDVAAAATAGVSAPGAAAKTQASSGGGGVRLGVHGTIAMRSSSSSSRGSRGRRGRDSGAPEPSASSPLRSSYGGTVVWESPAAAGAAADADAYDAYDDDDDDDDVGWSELRPAEAEGARRMIERCLAPGRAGKLDGCPALIKYGFSRRAAGARCERERERRRRRRRRGADGGRVARPWGSAAARNLSVEDILGGQVSPLHTQQASSLVDPA